MSVRSTNTLRYDSSGRKRKTKAFTSAKRRKQEFKEYKPTETLADQRIAQNRAIKSSASISSSAMEGRRVESPKYSGDSVLGIATMHKSNAVPVSSKKVAEEISRMSK